MDARSSIPGRTIASKAAALLVRLPLLLVASAPGLAVAQSGPRFAAAAPIAPFAAPSDGMPLIRVFFALLLVLAAVYAAAKLSRRMGVAGGTSAARLEVLAQTSLGPRERAVLLRVGERDVLLGVATGNVRLLLDMQGRTEPVDSTMVATSTTPAGGPAEIVRPSFRDLLVKSLGR
jgi:flagellar protein FliO/FliZ